MDEEDIEENCQTPCDPDIGCPNCAGYWQRMIDEGFWDDRLHKWTDKGWREMMK